MNDIPDLAGCVALVTGASRGIGQACALGLAKAGAHVVAVARTVGGLQELDDCVVSATGERATLVPLDLTDFEGIDRLGAVLFERYRKLDILIANAGITGALSPLPHLKPREFDRVVALNLTANWRLIRAMDPLMRLAPKSLAVFMTDRIAQASPPFWGAYTATKAALEMLVRTYKAEMEHTNVGVELFDPGPRQTKLRETVLPGADPVKPPAEDMIYPLLRDFFS